MASSTTNKTLTVNLTHSEWPVLVDWLAKHTHYREFTKISIIDYRHEYYRASSYDEPVYRVEFKDLRAYTHWVLTCV